MSIELQKIDSSCKLVELIDSNSCIGSSLEKINNSFLTFKNLNQKMVETLYERKEITSFFQPVSTKMIATANLIIAIDNIMANAYTTIKALSSKWNSKEFTLYYPQMFNVSYYYTDLDFNKNLILNWLNTNFEAIKFPEEQTINVYISLYYINSFTFLFKSSYLENCAPTAHGANTLSCNGCGGDNRHAGCNIDGQGCRNAYSYCNSQKVGQSSVYNCVGTIGSTYIYDTNFNPVVFNSGNTGLLSINYEIPNIEDYFLSRIIKMKFKSNTFNNAWEEMI